MIFRHHSRIWQNSGSRVIGRNAVSQSNCRILWHVISQGTDEMMKFIFGKQININVFYKLILSFSPDMPKAPKIRSFAYLFNISRKTLGIKLLFCLQINTKVFYSVMISLWVCVTRLSQSTQNNKFTISLQHLKENRKNQVDFLACR